MKRSDLPEHERRRVTNDELIIASAYEDKPPEFWWWKRQIKHFAKPLQTPQESEAPHEP